MEKKNYIWIVVIVILFYFTFLRSCGVNTLIENGINRLKAESKIDKRHAEELLKSDLETVFGKEYDKIVKYKYNGLIVYIPRGSSGPIPDFSIKLSDITGIRKKEYRGYKYYVYTSFLDNPITFNYSWNAEKDRLAKASDTYALFGIGKEASEKFIEFYLNKIGFDVENIRSAGIYIDTNDLNFDKVNLEKYDDEYIFESLKVSIVDKIIYKDGDLDINDVKNKLDSLSTAISNLYNNVENNYVGYNIQFGERGESNGWSPLTAYAETIDENYVYFKIQGKGVQEDELYRLDYDGVHNNKYINKINFKRVINDFLDKSNNDYNKLPIDDMVKINRDKYLSELKDGILEVVSYRSNYNDNKISFLLKYNNSIELLEYSFALSDNDYINDLKVDNRIMLVENGANEFDNFYGIKEDLWKNIFVLCNPQFMSDDMILSVTDSFYKNNIDFFEDAKSIFTKDTYVDKYKNKIYLLKGDDVYEYDYNLEIANNFLINDIKFIYYRKYENISKHNYENITNLVQQYLTKRKRYKLSSDLLNLIREGFDEFKDVGGIKKDSRSIYSYMNKSISEEEKMKNEIDGYLHSAPYSSNIYDKDSNHSRPIFNKYGVINVLKDCGLGDEFNLSNGRSSDLNFIVVKKEMNKVLLLADFVWPLTNRQGSGMTINYEYSNIRSNLNSLKKSLPEEIVNNLVETKLDNHSDNKYGINLGNDTNDKIFILSVDEMTQIKKECDFINDWTKIHTGQKLFSPHILRTAGRDKTTYAFTKIIELDDGSYDSEYSYEPNDYGSFLPSEKLTLATRPAMWVKIP